jgi:SAM-dependent methyltransferase
VKYDPTQFGGAAPYYLRGRPPYSAELGAVLARELHVDGTGNLLDVGCGPGTVGVQLAPLFDHVTFVEPDGDMLAEARAHAMAAGLTAVEFLRATAEDLADLDLQRMGVVTFGQSFHRTDRVRVAEAVYDILEPGGSMVLIVHDPSRPAPPQPANTSLIPHGEIRRLVRSFLGPELRSGARLAASYDAERFEETLARTRFGRPRIVFAKGRPDIICDAGSVIASYLSMSFAAPHLFGPRLPEFVDELCDLLERQSPGGRFWDWPGDTQVLIATRGLPDGVLRIGPVHGGEEDRNRIEC